MSDGYYYQKLQELGVKKMNDLMLPLCDAARERCCHLAQIRFLQLYGSKPHGHNGNSEEDWFQFVQAHLDLADTQPAGISLWLLMNKLTGGYKGGAWGPMGCGRSISASQMAYVFSATAIILPILAEDILFSFVRDYRTLHKPERESCYGDSFKVGALAGLFDVARILLQKQRNEVSQKLCEAVVAFSPELAGIRDSDEKMISHSVLTFLEAQGDNGPGLAKNILRGIQQTCIHEISKTSALRVSALNQLVSRLCLYHTREQLKQDTSQTLRLFIGDGDSSVARPAE